MGSEHIYEYDGADTLAGASYRVPVLWLFCFDVGSLTTFDVSAVSGEPGTVVSAVIPIGRGRDLLRARSSRLGTWPGLDRFYPEFVELIESCPFAYLKVDLFELGEMIDGLDEHLRAALAWFESGDHAHHAPAPTTRPRSWWRPRRRDRQGGDAARAALDEIASFRADEHQGSTMAHGFKCNRDVPWRDPA